MYHVAVMSLWRGLCKHKSTRPPFSPSQPATRLTWRQEGFVTRVALVQLNRCGRPAAGAARHAASSSTPTLQSVYLYVLILILALPPPRLASPRVSPGAMVLALPIYLFPAHRPPPAPSSVVCPLALTSLACPEEPLRKGAPPGQCPPSLLRHPNLDACLPCLCRIPITDIPMRLANHGPCPLAGRRVS